VPGLGLKFPVDGDRPSENAVVMRMLDPQSQHSVFENAFTNILPVPRFTNLAKHKTLVNHIGPFGMKATLAETYIGKSLIDKKDCIVLDYSKTSLVAKHIRDEIRQIAPKTYLVRSTGTRRSCSTSLSNSRVE